jgi:hypothetical protein
MDSLRNPHLHINCTYLNGAKYTEDCRMEA